MVSPEPLPKSPRCENRQRSLVGGLKQVLIAGHEHVGSAGDRFRYDGEIRPITQFQCQGGGVCHHDGLTTQEGIHFIDGVGGYPELPAQDAAEFGEDGLAHDQLVFGKSSLEDIGAESPSRDRTDQDVGVKGDLHETSRKTSSSVKYPRASAKGMMRRRRSSN